MQQKWDFPLKRKVNMWVCIRTGTKWKEAFSGFPSRYIKLYFFPPLRLLIPDLELFITDGRIIMETNGVYPAAKNNMQDKNQFIVFSLLHNIVVLNLARYFLDKVVLDIFILLYLLKQAHSTFESHDWLQYMFEYMLESYPHCCYG